MSCREGQHEGYTADVLSELLRGKVVLRLRQDEVMRLIVEFTDHSTLMITPALVDFQCTGEQPVAEEDRETAEIGGPGCRIPPIMIF